MSDLENIVLQVDRDVMVVSEVMDKLNEMGYKETPVELTSAYNANYIYTDGGKIYWDLEGTPTGWDGKTVKVKELLE